MTVFVDGIPVYKSDERIVESEITTAQDIPIGDLAPGRHTVGFRLDPFTDVQSVVRISNIELGFLEEQEIIDHIAPITTSTISGVLGTDGWHTGSTILTLNVVDDPDGVGVKATRYSVDNGGTWKAYIDPVTIADERTHTVQFSSEDWAGNREDPKSMTSKSTRLHRRSRSLRSRTPI